MYLPRSTIICTEKAIPNGQGGNRRKCPGRVAKVFYDGYQDLIDIEIKLEEKLERLAWKIFLKQTKKGTSFVDCANLAMMEMYKLDGVVT